MSLVLVSLMISCFFLFLPAMTQPLTLGLVILIMTLGGCSMCGLFMSSWYGYLLFLVYVGGLLVMFAYVAALIPNVVYWINYKYVVFMGLSFLGLLMLFEGFYIDSGLLSPESDQWDSYEGIELCTAGGLIVALAHVLLVSLVAVVKICYRPGGALRAFSSKS
uniref:NADH dehydrogenase subunit 6 n=1 Tax=Dendropoma gregarium TaxID=169306 RepID=Q94X57_9CAEN|nr:NADH dehydrogenase subunit 6 [Dendropoma gregarium]AAL04456.1 NADH dehydrogenase subunit 6 [Dendropoma gregarium]ADI79377.1 NADH dehydrogenase subunit 6 [Dendropoma gregarium]